jgi:Zn-dependent M28 family amino/carboxypeptidase
MRAVYLIPILAAACQGPRCLTDMTGVPPQAERVVSSIEAVRLRKFVDDLAGFGTRHTFSRTDSDTAGIGAARRYLLAQFESFGGRLESELESFTLEPGRRIPESVELKNVVAVLPGTMPEAAGRRYYVLGHYDSRASNGSDGESLAPGANDDASGVALVLELARVLADEELEATIVFLATAGEEQGLYGARYHVEQAVLAGHDIRAALSNDCVGDPSGPADASGQPRHDAGRVRVFSEGIRADADERANSQLRRMSGENDSASRQIARMLTRVAQAHALDVRPVLIQRPDRFLRGGDHSAFNENGIAAVRFTEVYEDYNRQHQDVRVEDGVQFGDLAEYVDAEYLAGVTRLNGAALVHLANAPSPPPRARMITATLANDTTLRWDASPEPDVAGYEVIVRETTSPMWQKVHDVGNVLEATIDLSKDNWFFGLRAYDHDGYRSPVVFPGTGRE